MTTVIMKNFGKVITNQITSLTFFQYKNTKFGLASIIKNSSFTEIGGSN